MKILIFGGFLGSGKTTLISKLLHGLSDSGHTAAVIENEIGEIGIDDKLIKEAGVSVTPLFGGCVCCQITGDLLTAAEKIRTELKPDWLVIEMTGLAMMAGIREVFAKYAPDIPVYTVSVADIARFDTLFAAARPLIEKQLGGADVVLVNKIDVVPPPQETLELIAQLSGGKVLPISARAADTDVWTLLTDNFKEGV